MLHRNNLLLFRFSFLAFIFLLSLAPDGDVQAQGGGQIINNTVFENEYIEDVTEETEQVVNSKKGKVYGVGNVFNDFVSYQNGFPTVYEATEESELVEESEIPDTIDSIIDLLIDELLTLFPGGSISSSSMFLNEDVDIIDSTLQRIDNGKTEEQQQSADVDTSNAVVIGDPNDLANLIVLSGTVYVTTTIKTITTQHYTDLTTETVNLTENYEADVISLLDAACFTDDNCTSCQSCAGATGTPEQGSPGVCECTSTYRSRGDCISTEMKTCKSSYPKGRERAECNERVHDFCDCVVDSGCTDLPHGPSKGCHNKHDDDKHKKDKHHDH